MNNSGMHTWSKIIRPRNGWFDIHLGELWRYRDLIGLFVWRDFVSVYKQTILGPLWYIIQPLLTTIVFTIFFHNIARLSTDGLPSFLFYFSGVIAWKYFADCLTSTANTFVNNAHIFGKVYFPRLTVPISIVISNLIAFGIQILLFIVVFISYWLQGSQVHPQPALFLLPVFVLQMAALGLGFGIIVSSMTIRYRDLSHLIGFGIQLWMFATPVVYPSSIIPENWRWIVLLNPMTPVIEFFRYASMGVGTISLQIWFTSLATTMFVLFMGIALFSRVERTFMDVV